MRTWLVETWLLDLIKDRLAGLPHAEVHHNFRALETVDFMEIDERQGAEWVVPKGDADGGDRQS
jgi:hypothetical protein